MTGLCLSSPVPLQEFFEVYFTHAAETSYVQTGLNFSAVYQFRLRAATTKTGMGQRGPAVSVTTLPYVVNPWHQVYARSITESDAGGGRRYIDPPTDEVSMLPRCVVWCGCACVVRYRGRAP